MRQGLLMGAGLLALLLATGAAQADRVPSRKTVWAGVPGVRPSIVVPYLTNTNSALGVYHGVAPRIYRSPVINDPVNPQARPVYNLPFWGGVQGYGGRSNGAVPRITPLTPQR